MGDLRERRKAKGRRSSDKLAGLLAETVSNETVREVEELLESIKKGTCNSLCFIANTKNGVAVVRLLGSVSQNKESIIMSMARLYKLIDQPTIKEIDTTTFPAPLALVIAQ